MADWHKACLAKCNRSISQCPCPLGPGHEGVFQRWVDRNKVAYRQARAEIEAKLTLRKLSQKAAEKAESSKKRQFQLFDPATSMHLGKVAQQLGLHGAFLSRMFDHN